MKKFNYVFMVTMVSIFVTSVGLAKGKIQNSDIKSKLDLQTAYGTITGDLSSGSACIASPSSLTGLYVGQYIYDQTTAGNIQSGATIAGLPGSCSSGQIQMSSTATATATGDSISFGGSVTELINDSKLWLTSTTPPQQLSSAIASGAIGGGGGGSVGKNYLSNDKFESFASGNFTSWTKTGATATADTSGMHEGSQAASLALSAAGSMYQDVTPTQDLSGSNLEAGLWVKTAEAGVQVCARKNGAFLDGLYCNSVPTSNVWTYVSANMVGPTQGTSIGVGVKWSGSSGTVKVDGPAWLGGATNLSQVSQAYHVGTLKYAATASCAWSGGTTNVWSSYGADTDCPTPTVTGSLQAPGTKIPAFVMNVEAGASYRITAKGYLNQGPTGSTKFRFSDGTDSTEMSGLAAAYTGVYNAQESNLSSIYIPTTSGLKTIEIQAYSTNAPTNVDAGTSDLVFEVEKFPTQSQLAVNSTAVTTSWSGYFQNTGSPSWYTASVGYADPTLTGTATLVEMSNKSFGTVTAAAGSLPGITFTPKVGARYKVTVDLQMTGDISSYAEARLTDGTTTVAEIGGIMAPGATLGPVGLSMSGVYVPTSSSPVTLKVQISSNSGNAYIRQQYSSRSYPLGFTITEIGGVQNSPVLVGSVTSSSTLAIETARMDVNCTSSPCSLGDKTDGIASITRAGTGNYTINFNSGVFSSAPTCTSTCHAYGSDWMSSSDFVTPANTRTATAIQFITATKSGVTADTACTIQCIGKK